MKRTAIFVDRTALGKAVLLQHGTDKVPDYEKLVTLLAPGEPEPYLHLWAVELPPGLVTRFEGYGWTVTNLRRNTPGLIEADMGMTAANLPGGFNRFVFVSGSNPLEPIVRRLSQEGEEVVVAAFEHDIAQSLKVLPKVEILHLDFADFLRRKGG